MVVATVVMLPHVVGAAGSVIEGKGCVDELLIVPDLGTPVLVKFAGKLPVGDGKPDTSVVRGPVTTGVVSDGVTSDSTGGISEVWFEGELGAADGALPDGAG